MRVFRRTEREFALHALLYGRFRISRLSYFRSIENVGVGIRDELEGMVIAPFGDVTVKGGSELSERLQPYVAIGENASVRFVNSRIHCLGPDYWVLCFTDREDAELPGDTAFAVSSVEQLASALQRAHPDRLGNFQIGKVRYEKRSFDVRYEPIGNPDPFVKADEERFRAQSEIRICWEARNDDLQPFFTLSQEAARLVQILE